MKDEFFRHCEEDVLPDEAITKTKRLLRHFVARNDECWLFFLVHCREALHQQAVDEDVPATNAAEEDEVGAVGIK